MSAGRVRYIVRTAMAEKLISRASEEGVRFEYLSRPDARTLDAWVNAADGRAFSALLDGLSIEYRVAGAEGFARLARFLRRRVALIPSAAAAVAVVIALSMRIWVVSVSGAGDEAAVRRVLGDLGVRPGARKSAVDVSALSRQLEAALPEYAFFGVKASGVYLLVDARAADEAPQVYERADARDLVADADGVVLRVNTAAGRALVKPGDTVRKGDVLIAGEERVSASGDTRRVRAQGSVTARLWTEGFSRFPLAREEKTRTGRVSQRVTLVTPFFEKCLSGADAFEDCETERETMAVVGLFLPAKLVRETRYECGRTTKEEDVRALEAAAKARAVACARACAPDGAREADMFCECETRGGELRVRCAIEWEKEIAR